MTVQNLDYFYDEQLRRYITQFMRIFSGFVVSEGDRGAGELFSRVPVRYATFNRLVSHILKNNSENVVNSAPFFSVSIANMAIARDRAQDPYNVDRSQITERAYDEAASDYTSEPGNLYTVERYMPVPYNLTMTVDLWTNNLDHKLQLWEQILVLFNPSIQLQSNSNPLDWTNVFEVTLTDINFSSRSQPAGVDENLDIASMTFEMGIWISPPAKVKRQKIINTIITNIHTADNLAELDFSSDVYDFFGGIANDSTMIVTPNNQLLRVDQSNIVLLQDNGAQLGVWSDLLTMLSPQTSTGTAANSNITALPITTGSTAQLNLTNDLDDTANLVTGTIAETANPSVLSFTLDSDTLPANTLDSVKRAVDPQQNYPGDGVLDNESLGDRYLLVNDVQELVPRWGVQAVTHDIIEYDGTQWNVVFDSTQHEDTEYLLVSNQGQFKWTGTEWISSWQGVYHPGYWKLNL